MMTCTTTIVAFFGHRSFNVFKHLLVPAAGILINIACMAFYIVAPFVVTGMSRHEPFLALVVVGVWGLVGFIYFLLSGEKTMLQATGAGAALDIPWATVAGSLNQPPNGTLNYPPKPSQSSGNPPPLPAWYRKPPPDEWREIP